MLESTRLMMLLTREVRMLKWTTLILLESSYHQFLSGEKNITGSLIPLHPTFSYFFIVLFIFFKCKLNYLIIFVFVLLFSSLNLCDSIIYRLPLSWWRGLCRLQRGRFKDHTGERGRRRREIYLLLFMWYNYTCITILYFHSSAIVRDINLFLFYFHPWLILFRSCFCFFFFSPKGPRWCRTNDHRHAHEKHREWMP